MKCAGFELFSLSLLLKCAVDPGIDRLQRMGDSKLLKDWGNGKNRIVNLVLRPIMFRVSKVKRHFLETFSITFTENSMLMQKIHLKLLKIFAGRDFICGQDSRMKFF